MPTSRIFSGQRSEEIERQLSSLLNSAPDLMSPQTISSPRATGDAIQSYISEHFQGVVSSDCAEYSGEFARRAMADLAFTGTDQNYYRIDVKTHRMGTQFSMPNLTSAKRLADFYEDDSNYFVILLVQYEISDGRLRVRRTHFVPIEWLDWNCLTIGSLGWGQIQIANSNNISILRHHGRRDWMIDLCTTMIHFYENEIGKIGARSSFFVDARSRWQGRKSA